MSDFIGIDVIGETELIAKLDKLPEAARDSVVNDVVKYLLDVLRTYPPRKSVTRKEAYGRSFFTDKQRRYFFWALANGNIKVPYNRTQTLRKNWKQVGTGYRSIIVNETEYAGLVMGDQQQSRHAIKIGWESTTRVLKDRWARIQEKAEAGIKNAIKKVGL